MNEQTRANTKSSGMWNKLQLRGRLLSIMLAVALSVVLLCAGFFAFTLTRMLQSSREDARALSDNVHQMVEMAFYQQETHIRQIYAMAQASLLERRLAALTARHETPDWDALLGEAYDLIDNMGGSPDPELLKADGTMAFLWAEGTFYVRGADVEGFMASVNSFYRRMYESDEPVMEMDSFVDNLREDTLGAAYITGDDGALLAWSSFGSDAHRIGMLVPHTGALRMSEGLRELMDAETAKAFESIATATRRSAAGMVVVMALLLIALPLISRRLAFAVVNPVEQEQRRQRDLLRIMEEENAMLERLDRLKTEFLGNVSHELKTPLTVMSGYAQYSGKTLAKSPEMAEVEGYMKLIAAEADRLGLMVTQILDLTRIEEGRMTVDPRPASIAVTIQQTVNTYYPLFAKNNNTLIIEASEGLANALCDEARIAQVLVNLISNAAKHTRDGTITIAARAAGGFIAVSVEDTGSGIEASLLPQLFERYKTYAVNDEKARDGKQGGTGLGLYICKHIVEAHGGTIAVQSQAGVGTTVTFTLAVETSPS
jgi:signal transduction histidine kinase